MLVEVGIVVWQELVFVFIEDFEVFCCHVFGHESSLLSGMSDEFDWVSAPDLVSGDYSTWRDYAVWNYNGSFFDDSSLENHRVGSDESFLSYYTGIESAS